MVVRNSPALPRLDGRRIPTLAEARQNLTRSFSDPLSDTRAAAGTCHRLGGGAHRTLYLHQWLTNLPRTHARHRGCGLYSFHEPFQGIPGPVLRVSVTKRSRTHTRPPRER